MLAIILCDDDPFILKLAKDKVEEVIELYHLAARICCITTDSGEVFRYMKQNAGPFLVFLDLDFGAGKLNGIDIAKQIKSNEYEAKIVFATNHQEMAMRVLKSGVEPYGFLEKTTDFNQLGKGYLRYIQMAVSSMEKNSDKEETIQLVVGIDETISIQKNQILYIESEKSVSHGISYHTLDGSCITVRDTMEQIQTNLGEEFARVHRSILVQKRYVVGFDGMNLRLSNGEQVSCSVRMRSEVKRWLKQ